MSNSDLTSIINLCRQIQLDELLITSIEAVMKNANSEKGCLLLFDFLTEVLLVKSNIVDRVARTEIDRCTLETLDRHLPSSIIEHVSSTGETIAIDSASENNYTNDAYFLNFQPRSILCLPILHREEVVGIFYLENYSVGLALTQEGLEIINIFGSQTAISVENAKLYFQLQQAQLQEREKAARLEKNLLQLENAQQELLETKNKLEYDAFHDPLTGLPNRAWLLKLLERSIELAARHSDYLYALLFLDLDDFKAINDNLGHLIGDELLKQVAQRLQTCLRTTDTISRLGGDEFAILLEIDNSEEATAIAERILAQLSRPFVIDEREIFTSTSIGIAFGSRNYRKPKDILRDADVAMYRAKTQGKGRYLVFDRTMEAQIRAGVQIETALQEALTRQELSLYYQPIVLTATGILVGFEVLLRWNHSSQGWISPSEFIPIAEETGAISEICWWVITSACRQLSLWRDLFPEKQITININLSALQLKQENLLQRLQTIWQENQLPEGSLKLEITENCILETFTVEAQTLMKLKDSGISLCVDDFGIGYSSLSHLHEFPIDTLKIDRSFVRRMGQDSQHAEVVQTIVTLAHSLNMDVIAEGVETVQQLQQLQELNCEYIQGYLVSQPIDELAATQLLERDNLLDLAR
ncbi:putative bifunctional diguanylate cyclase/phosphodiesterase [Myxosarcina sp. GI1(2024)]